MSDGKKDYEVGYGKPPHSSQFKKGQSGNPKGRPKDSATFVSTLKRALNKVVKVRINGQIQDTTTLEAIVQQIVNEAMRGNEKSWRFIKPYLDKIDYVADKQDSKEKQKLQSDISKEVGDLLQQIGQRQSGAAAENERLRALLYMNGIDPDDS